jgi:hypothetical protein
MRRVTIRLPNDLVEAYDAADGGSRSHVMRRVLLDAVAEGDVEGVPADLRTLAERERAVDTGRLARKRATYKKRLLDFYGDKWEDGAVTPTDAADLATSWRAEASLYDRDRDGDGTPHEDLLDTVLDWYRANWSRTAAERPEWPDAGRLFRAAGIGADDEAGGLGVPSDLVDAVNDHASEDVEPSEAAQRVAESHNVRPSEALAAIRASDEYDTEHQK